MKCIRIRESKYGTALVLETSEFSGGYVLGFKVEKLEEVFQEVTRLFKTYMAQPFFGVECVFEESEKNIDEVTIPRVEDKLEIVDTGYEEHVRALRKRYEVGKKQDKPGAGQEPDICYNDDIGLACEVLPQGVTLD